MKNQIARRSGTPQMQSVNVETLAAKARELLKSAFEEVKQATSVENEKKLFPNGIDLIYVKLEAGFGQVGKLAAELKLAGPGKNAAITENEAAGQT